MNKTVLAGLALLILSGQAWAEPTGIEAAFGNTVISVFPDGRQGKLWLNPDGTYTGEGRKHDPSSGAWTTKPGQICMKQSKPISVPFNFCTPFPSDGAVGATWKAKSVWGDPIVIKVVAGR